MRHTKKEAVDCKRITRRSHTKQGCANKNLFGNSQRDFLREKSIRLCGSICLRHPTYQHYSECPFFGKRAAPNAPRLMRILGALSDVASSLLKNYDSIYIPAFKRIQEYHGCSIVCMHVE